MNTLEISKDDEFNHIHVDSKKNTKSSLQLKKEAFYKQTIDNIENVLPNIKENNDEKSKEELLRFSIQAILGQESTTIKNNIINTLKNTKK